MPATVLVEGALFAGGVALALRATRPRDAVGGWGFVAFVAFLVVAYVGNLFGPPPPSVQALGWFSLSAPALLLPVIAWVDSHREPANISRTPA